MNNMNLFYFFRRVAAFVKIKLAKSVTHLEQVTEYIIKGDSMFFSNFYLSIPRPVDGKKYLMIGENSMIGGKFTFEAATGEIKIGNRVYIAGGDMICIDRITIEDDVFISWNVYFFDNDSHSLDYKHRLEDMTNHIKDWKSGKDNYNYSKNWKHVKSAPIKVCRYAWIGMEVTILKGVTIGEGAIVGAGSVVTRDVEPWTIVGGNPAKFIRRIEKSDQS